MSPKVPIGKAGCSWIPAGVSVLTYHLPTGLLWEGLIMPPGAVLQNESVQIHRACQQVPFPFHAATAAATAASSSSSSPTWLEAAGQARRGGSGGGGQQSRPRVSHLLLLHVCRLLLCVPARLAMQAALKGHIQVEAWGRCTTFLCCPKPSRPLH